MEKTYSARAEALTVCPLFYGMTAGDITQLMQCLSAKTVMFDKSECILDYSEFSGAVGIVISGEAQTVSDDYWGNRTILMRHEKDDLFGENFACSQNEIFPVSVVAAKKTEVVLVSGSRIIMLCEKRCNAHVQMMKNMLGLVSGQNISLMRKLQYISRRSTREKLLAYLSGEEKRAGSSSFEIPFKREELAEFLSVDRSAMSKELSRMRDDGIIEYRTNHFTLFKTDKKKTRH